MHHNGSIAPARPAISRREALRVLVSGMAAGAFAATAVQAIASPIEEAPSHLPPAVRAEWHGYEERLRRFWIKLYELPAEKRQAVIGYIVFLADNGAL